MAGEFDGRVAIVTGGGSGIARATARLLGAGGALVALFDVDEGAGTRCQAELQAAGVDAAFFRCNVTSWADVMAQTEAVLGRFGQVDVLVNVVGGSDGVAGTGPAWTWEMSEENWDGMLALNLKSAFLCCRAVLPHMVQRRSGSIVNTSSGRGFTPAPERAHYSAAKAGVMALTRTMAAEVAPYRIRVNAVAPGVTATERARNTFTEQGWREFTSKLPLGKAGEPEDLAQAIVFLASPRAGHITGQLIHVNGGTFMP